MYTVYILYSPRTDKYYVGYTNNLERRFSEHNRKKGKFTDAGIPWEIVHTESFNSKKEAQAREAYIKCQKSKHYIKSLTGGSA